MDTTNRLFLAFAGAAAVFFVFVWAWTRWKRRARLDDPVHLEQVLREVAPGLSAEIAAGGLRFVHRGLEGRMDFISDKTEIQVRTRDLLGQVVEVVPNGFPLSLVHRLRARGSKAEYDRIFRRPDDERVLHEVGVTYELRMSPEGVILRLHALPGSAAELAAWIGCAFRIVDLIPGCIS